MECFKANPGPQVVFWLGVLCLFYLFKTEEGLSWKDAFRGLSGFRWRSTKWSTRREILTIVLLGGVMGWSIWIITNCDI